MPRMYRSVRCLAIFECPTALLFRAPWRGQLLQNPADESLATSCNPAEETFSLHLSLSPRQAYPASPFQASLATIANEALQARKPPTHTKAADANTQATRRYNRRSYAKSKEIFSLRYERKKISVILTGLKDDPGSVRRTITLALCVVFLLAGIVFWFLGRKRRAAVMDES